MTVLTLLLFVSLGYYISYKESKKDSIAFIRWFCYYWVVPLFTGVFGFIHLALNGG